MTRNSYFSRRSVKSDGLHLDVGPFVRALEYAADIEARVLGGFFKAVLDDVEVAPKEALMVGDDVECDVVAALEVGLQAALVRTGKYREGDEKRARGAQCEAGQAELVAKIL